MKNPVFDASTYTKYIKERSNVKLYNSDRDTKVPQGERSSIISRPPVQDKGTNGLLAIFSKEVKRFLVNLFAGNGSGGIPTDGQLAALSPLTNSRSITINPTNTNQIIIGCANPGSGASGGNLILSVNKSTGVITRFAGTGFFTSNTISGDAIVSAAVGDGTHVTYTTTSAHGFANGASVRVIGLSLPQLNITGNVFDSPSTTTFRLAAAVTGNHSGNNGSAGIKAVDARLGSPHSAVFDSLGNYYYVEQFGCVVRRIDTDGYISRYAGTTPAAFSFNGNNKFRIDDTNSGTGNNGVMFRGPRGIAIDNNNNIYIADTDNWLIRKIDYSSGIISTIVGVTGVQGVPTEGQLGTAASLRGPTALAFDKDYQNLYILDYASAVNPFMNGVYRYNIADGRVYIIHQSYNVTGLLLDPRGLALDSDGKIYVSDFGPNARVFGIDPITKDITLYAGGGNSTNYSNVDRLDVKLQNIFSLCFDTNRTLYVVMTGAQGRVVTIQNTPVTSIEI